MHVWTKPIWWNHRGRHDHNSTFEAKLTLSPVLFCFFPACLSVSGCFLTTRQDLAWAPTLTAPQKPPNHQHAAKTSDQLLSLPVSVSLTHRNGVMGHFIVLFYPRGGRGRTRGSGSGVGGAGDKANFVLCGFSVVSETSPTLPPAQAPFLSQFYFLTQPL